ncbi:Alpha-1,3-mannosyl-glycoprotein 4-beta-N-acetylglucosaminyltransferase A [Parelaphostrongylus tenuis]|nr:Alpha-1,3-mannosyl-glycoprotein 4-beta-N-acetylglucosaminyltransferase A [Parelaphostrongylus tenuis]
MKKANLQTVAEATCDMFQELCPQDLERNDVNVIAVPKAWYRIDVRSISPTFNDSPERMYWRTKQNIDYIYIMMHASQICDYYLQLEDDVEAADGYMRVIFNYLTFKSDSPWFIISFTSMGFIGRLFRSSDLKYMSYAIALYHHFKPVDWILYDLLTSRYCDPGKTHQECLANRRQYEISSGASQFQHIGKISSLEGKTQTIHDSRFGKGATQGKRGNPPANVTSSVRTKKFHEPQFGYDNYFAMWLLNVTSGDYVSMVFHEEILLTGVMFMSGLPPVPQYKLGPEALVYAFNNADERVHLGQFSSKGDFLLRLKGLLVTELRIEFTAPLQNEVVIDHILIDKQENS